jgi:hypothetical protein
MCTPGRIVVVMLWLLLGFAGPAWAPDAAPEIDPTSGAAGLTLVVGSVLLYLESRFRR